MDIFYALSAPTRRSIMEMLSERGSLSATEISDKFPASPPAISQHLKVLREAKLVTVEKQGQQRIYRISSRATHELEEWTHKISQQWNERFNRLDKVLEKQKK